MGIDGIYKIDWKPKKKYKIFGEPTGANLNIDVHCECNNDYAINESFKNFVDVESRITECKSCKDETFLTYRFAENDDSISLTWLHLVHCFSMGHLLGG